MSRRRLRAGHDGTGGCGSEPSRACAEDKVMQRMRERSTAVCAMKSETAGEAERAFAAGAVDVSCAAKACLGRGRFSDDVKRRRLLFRGCVKIQEARCAA